MKKREGNKTQRKNNGQYNVQPIPQQQSAPPGQIPPVYLLGMMLCDMELPFGQLQTAVLAVLSPGFFCLLAEHGKPKSS